MRWLIVVYLGALCLLLLASVRAKEQEVRWVQYFGTITTLAADHFLPFLFADPSVYYLKGWLSRGVVLLMCVGGMRSRDEAESKNSRWVSSNVLNMMLKTISHLAIAASPSQLCLFDGHVVGLGWWLVWVMLWTVPRNIMSSKKFSRWVNTSRQNMLMKCFSHLQIAAPPRLWCI